MLTSEFNLFSVSELSEDMLTYVLSLRAGRGRPSSGHIPRASILNHKKGVAALTAPI